MATYETRISQLGLVHGNRQSSSDLTTIVEPKTFFAPESRKGHLYILAEAEQGLSVGKDVCQIAMRMVQKTFYEDSSLSITSSLRAALRGANKTLYHHNLNASLHGRTYVGMTCVVTKGSDLFIAQVAPAQAYVLTEGSVRAMPVHPSWNPAHTSTAPFLKSNAMGSSLFVEPEFYRCLIGAKDSFLICSSNFARILGLHDVEPLLRNQEHSTAIEHLYALCKQQGFSDGHALLVKFLAARHATTQKSSYHVEQEHKGKQTFFQSLGSLFGKSADQASAHAAKTDHDISAKEQPVPKQEDSLQRLPEQPNLPPSPIPLPRPLNLGENLQERQPEFQSQPSQPSVSSALIGEEREESIPYRRAQSSRDLERLSSFPPKARPYRPRVEARPWVDMNWQQRLLFILQNASIRFEKVIQRKPNLRRLDPLSQALEQTRGISRKPEKPSFPWLQLVAIGLLVALLIVYGVNLSRQSAERQILEYINQSRQYLIDMQRAANEEVAFQKLEQVRQLLEQVQSSPLVTTTNPILWLPFKEVRSEYERGLGTVQRLTFFEQPKIVTQHPKPDGRFSRVVVPPQTAQTTDTLAIEATTYIYALDGDRNNARLYRVPRQGGSPEPYLSPEDSIQNTLVGQLKAIAWRVGDIVAIDQTSTNFGYYFRNNGIWNYIRLGGSEIWVPLGQIDMETYEGNLYIWGVEAGEVVKFTSGHYGDIPQLWLNASTLENVDLSTAIDLAVDGKVYLLMPTGRVFVFHLGQLEREIVPEEINPRITTVTRMFVTGTPEKGEIFLLDTLNERVIEMDKQTGKIIQQTKMHPDHGLPLNQLTDMYVGDNSGQPMMYLVNGKRIIQAVMPIPPTPFKNSP